MSFDEANFPDLPVTWTYVVLDDASEVVPVKNKVQTKNYLERGDLAIVDQGSGLVGGYTNDASMAVAADLPVVVFGDHTRAIKYIDFPFAAGADGIKVLRPTECFLPRLFFRFIQTLRLPDRGYARHFQYLRRSRMPVPSLSEQQRIADKLDAVLARVDACRERLDRVPATLKRFRQAVLAAATSGELTEGWRIADGLETPWRPGMLGDVGAVTGGLTKNSKRASFPLRKRYLRVANVYAGRLELADVAEIGLTESEYEKTRLRVGDLLIVEGNGSVDQIGRAAMWNGELEQCTHQNHLIRWRSNGTLEPAFALIWLLSPTGRMSLATRAASSAGLYTLSISKVSVVPIMIPPLSEQAEIVRRVESLFAYADHLEARYAAARAQVERLTPALLAKAFRGELVPQDPNDEPASVLLERIRAARAAAPAKPKRVRAAASSVSGRQTATPDHGDQDQLAGIARPGAGRTERDEDDEPDSTYLRSAIR